MESEAGRALLVGSGGFVGAAARYLLGGLVHRHYGGTFPLGTWTVNVLGCLIMGVLAALVLDRPVLDPRFRLFTLVGVLGGFTTFSSFSYETLELWRQGSLRAAALNIAGTLAGTLIATYFGWRLARAVFT
jgi:CrcB protein